MKKWFNFISINDWYLYNYSINEVNKVVLCSLYGAWIHVVLECKFRDHSDLECNVRFQCKLVKRMELQKY